ncbi:MAG: WS/DGAT domain-containing protein [Vulcanimicrobiota bacterium]
MTALTRADAAWLHMEEPSNLMTITGLFLLEGRLDRPWLERHVVTPLMSHDRFGCKVVDPTVGPPHWVEDAELELDHHLVMTESTPERLLDLVGQWMSQPLDRSRPLWQIHAVWLGADTALVIRVHHAMGDGVAMMKVLTSLADNPPPPSRGRSPRPGLGRVGAWLSALGELIFGVLLSPEPASNLKGSLGRTKLAAVSGPIPLSEVKRIEKKVRGTVNDVLLATLTGALRRHLQKTGQSLPANLRAVMPVDLRPARDLTLGNQFGLAFAALPVGIDDPLERLRESRRRLLKLKNTPHAAILYGVLRLAGCLPVSLELALVRLFGSRASLVSTNVHGPEQRLVVGGVPVSQLMFWVPQSGRLALGVSIISYAGEVRVGVASDAGVVDPQALVAEFEGAFAELAMAT